MSLTENSNQVFLPGGCNKLAKWPIYISVWPLDHVVVASCGTFHKLRQSFLTNTNDTVTVGIMNKAITSCVPLPVPDKCWASDIMEIQ